MPELPEVETVARGIDRLVRGRTIVSVWLGSKPEPFRSTPADIAAALAGAAIAGARRVGKHIVMDLARESAARPSRRSGRYESLNSQWVVHLGMTGRLLVVDPGTPVPPHTHAILHLDDGREIRFVDPRRFGRLAVLEGGFTGPGSEPLDISAGAFRALFRGRRTPIKSALLNQKLLHGVGNIYADESLFRAGLRPRRLAGRLSGRELDRLRESLQEVLREAITLGGSSVSDYVDADGARGFFQLQHRVYLRTGEPCLVCDTPIRRILLGGRGTHYCPHCQH